MKEHADLTKEYPNGKKRVCIVGGGPAGLSALRRVLDSPTLTGTLFEQKDDVGGLWNYKGSKEFATSPKNLNTGPTGPEGDPEQVTTMYDCLSCNVPGVLMELEDFPHPQRDGFAPTQAESYKYYKSYASHFNLWPHIQLNTAIVSVRPETPITPDTIGESGRWIVETHEHRKDVSQTEIFDAIIVCSGKNSYPSANGEIPGLANFAGDVIHSKFFKNADRYRNKDVVIIGLGASGLDQAIILSRVAHSVTICNRGYAKGMFVMGLVPPGVRETTGIKLVTASGVVTQDDEVIPCDSLILSTGYGVKYPFLETECQVEIVNDKYVSHLHNMTIFTKRPTLAITNLIAKASEILFAEAQARYFVSYLEGKLELPLYAEMEARLARMESKKKAQGLPPSAWTLIGPYGKEWWKLYYKMMKECGLEEEYRHAPLLGSLREQIFSRVFGKAALYKKDRLRIVEDKVTMELILHHSPDFPESKPGIVRMSLQEDWSVKVENLKDYGGKTW